MAEHVCTETPVVKTSKSLLCCRTLKKKRSEETKTKFTCKQKIALIMLALGDFMSVCSMSIITPFYPSVSAKKGVPSSLSGCIFAIYALIMFLFCPIFGKITPKLGAKPLFVIGAFAAGISNISFGLIDRFDSYNLFIISSFGIRIIEALGASAYSVATYVLIIDIFPQHIGFVRGLLETCIGLGLCAGPGLGGLLYGVGGFGLPFYVTGSVAIFVAFVNMHILPSPKEENIDEGGSFLDLLRLPPIFLTCIITTVVAMSNSFIDPTYEPHLSKTFGLTPTQVGLLFILDSATYGCSSPIFGWITDRTVNYSWLMTTGLFGTSAALLFLGPSPFLTFLKSSVWLNAVCLTGFGITTAMTIIPTYQYIIDTADANGFQGCTATHSKISGIWSSVYSLGEVIGPILGGLMTEHFDFPITSSTLAAINFCLAIGTMIFFKMKIAKSKRKSDKAGIDNVAYNNENNHHKTLNLTKNNSDSDLICIRF